MAECKEWENRWLLLREILRTRGSIRSVNPAFFPAALEGGFNEMHANGTVLYRGEVEIVRIRLGSGLSSCDRPPYISV